MKTLLTTTAAFLLAGCLPANAQDYLLYQHKDWSVFYYEEDGGNRGCLAEVSTGTIAFSVSYDDFGLDLNVFDRNRNWEATSDATIRVWVDRRRAWRVPAAADGQHIWGNITEGDFLSDVYQGRSIYFDVVGRDDWDYRFSLSGSAAALRAMNDCKNKL